MPDSRNQADVEYAVMLDILNFQTEFMKSDYSHAHVSIRPAVIEVLLTRSRTIPAEAQLARSPRGHALLQQVHAELFSAGEPRLRENLERTLGVPVEEISCRLDPIAGSSTITIRLSETFTRPFQSTAIPPTDQSYRDAGHAALLPTGMKPSSRCHKPSAQ